MHQECYACKMVCTSLADNMCVSTCMHIALGCVCRELSLDKYKSVAGLLLGSLLCYVLCSSLKLLVTAATVGTM